MGTSATADQTYKTQRYPVTAVVGGQTVGSVINIHANGPQIYGLERYSLTGAQPSTTYQVTLTVYGDPTCLTPALPPFNTVMITTNQVGNGHAGATFTAAAVAQIVTAPSTVTGRWTFSVGGVVQYTTGCHEINLDVPPAP